jgi:ABC-type transport system involved in cytochrome bd biosynthesis fused ATPase/permease subunit
MQTRFLTRAVPALYQSTAFLLLVLALAVVYLSDATAIAKRGAVVLVLVRSLTYGQQIQTATTGLNELIPYMSKLRDALEQYAAHPQPNGSRRLDRVERLGMTDVHFAYARGQEVLRGVSFGARRGEAIVIVGSSGAGKSTLVQLIGSTAPGTANSTGHCTPWPCADCNTTNAHAPTPTAASSRQDRPRDQTLRQALHRPRALPSPRDRAVPA